MRAHALGAQCFSLRKIMTLPIFIIIINIILKRTFWFFDAGWSTALPVHAPSSVNNNCGYNLPQVFGFGNLWVIAQKLNPKLEYFIFFLSGEINIQRSHLLAVKSFTLLPLQKRGKGNLWAWVQPTSYQIRNLSFLSHDNLTTRSLAIVSYGDDIDTAGAWG